MVTVPVSYIEMIHKTDVHCLGLRRSGLILRRISFSLGLRWGGLGLGLPGLNNNVSKQQEFIEFENPTGTLTIRALINGKIHKTTGLLAQNVYWTRILVRRTKIKIRKKILTQFNMHFTVFI